MAPRTIVSNPRGSALLEAVPVTALLAVFVAALMTAAYLTFAQAWVQSASEQALYCLAENRTEALCRRGLRLRISQALPLGEVGLLKLSRDSQSWKIELEWKWSEFKIRIAKRLRLKDMTGKKVLQW
jgi:hypothetical protein